MSEYKVCQHVEIDTIHMGTFVIIFDGNYNKRGHKTHTEVWWKPCSNYGEQVFFVGADEHKDLSEAIENLEDALENGDYYHKFVYSECRAKVEEGAEDEEFETILQFLEMFLD